MDKLAGMAMFVRVVEAGSFAAAADKSQVSATMVAKHISQIEERLGARLLHRTTRRHQLTEIGQLYYDRCKRTLFEFDLAEASASELQTSPRGEMRIVAPVSFGAEILAPVLANYLERNKEARVDLVLDNSPADLFAGHFHLGIHIGEIDSGDLVARPLQAYRRILAAAPDYLARHGRPAEPHDLCDHACLGLSYWRKSEFLWALVGPDGQTCDVAVRGRFSANQGRALRAAALSGAGIILQPDLLLEADIASGRLEHVLPDWSYKPRPMYLVYARDQRPTALLRSVIDFLTAHFGEA